ncbi:unnamed protein product [Phaeothamnion confervicola]
MLAPPGLETAAPLSAVGNETSAAAAEGSSTAGAALAGASRGSRTAPACEMQLAAEWKVPADKRRGRAALRAHEHAAAAARGGERWWVVRLPEDAGAPPVDVRRVVSPWPFPTAAAGGGFGNRGGKGSSVTARITVASPAPGLDPAAVGLYDDDEASLWWHAYARKGGSGGGARADETATLLLERVKLGPMARAAAVEADVQRRRLAVRRNADILVEQVRGRKARLFQRSAPGGRPSCRFVLLKVGFHYLHGACLCQRSFLSRDWIGLPL